MEGAEEVGCERHAVTLWPMPAGVLTLLGRLNPAIGVPSWAMYVWFAGALWVGFISVFGGWFVSQM